MASDGSLWLANLLYTRMIGRVLPARWFGPPAPRPEALSASRDPLQLEIVSHCWQYAHLLRYQLSSLVHYPPTQLNLTYTLYHSPDDSATCALLAEFADMDVPNVTWQWRSLPTKKIMRRAIGRNDAALRSTADWIWFADCDLMFRENCLDSLAAVAPTVNTGMIFPQSEQITALLPADHELIRSFDEPNPPTLVDVDPLLFHQSAIDKAKGAFQIVHGDVARASGYCKELSIYQAPTDRWRKTYEDTVFRQLIGYQGVPADIQGLYRIRHIAKGRYADKSTVTRVRKSIRKAQEKADASN